MRSISCSRSAGSVPSGCRIPGRSIVRTTVFVGLAGVAGLLGGCSSAKSPPKLPMMATTPITVPVPATPADASMFGYLRVDNLQALLKRVGGAQVEQLAAQRGLNLGELQAGAPVMAFVWDPQGATPQEAPVVVLAPVPAEGGMMEMVKAVSPAVRVTPVGAAKTTSAITLGEAAQERVKTDGEALLVLAQTKGPFELTLFVNALPIMAKYGPMLRAGIAAMGPMLALATPPSGSAATPSPKSTMAMLDQMVSGLSELKSFTIGSNVTQSALELSLVTQQKTGDKGSGPQAVSDLAQFVPPGHIRMQWNTRDFKKLVDWYLRMYGAFLDEKPALKAQVEAAITDWLKAGRVMQTALSMDYRSGQGLTMRGIMRVEDGPAAMAAVRRSVKLFSEGPVHDLYKSMGIELQITSKPGVRKLQGNAVDRYEYTMKTNPEQPNVDPAVKAMFSKLSGLSYEIVQTGPYLVYTLGAPVESVADPLFTGHGPYPMAAMKAFPAGGSLYLELDVAQSLEALKGLVPADSSAKLPTLPAQGSMVSMWSYDSGATSYQRVVIPTQLLQNIAAAAR